MKILIVHDDLAIGEELKVQLSEFSEVEVATNLAIARNLMAKEKFEFLILDLVLPDYEKAAPRIDGGYNFLKEIDTATWIKKPTFIITVTNHDDVEDQYKESIRDMLYNFVNTKDSDWKDNLKIKMRSLIRKRQESKDNSVGQFDICVLTALEKEITPFKNLLGLRPLEINGDPLGYYEGEIETASKKKFKIVFCSLNLMGMPHTAFLASRAIHNFRPKILLMSGICGGVEKDVNLGDIVIGTKSYDYSAGKLYDDGETVDHKFSAPCCNVSLQWQQKLSELPEKYVLKDFLKDYISTDANLNPEPKIHVGTIASGPFVVASQIVVNKILQLDRKILGLDMESFSIYLSKEFCSIHSAPVVFSVKSVSDRADVQKDDKYHNYGCKLSAGFIIELIRDDFFN